MAKVRTKAKSVPAGFGADGLTINDPETYLESILIRKLIGLERAGPSPRIEESPPDHMGNLYESPKDNEKQYKDAPEVGLRRLAASGASNNCWFDAFLMCMSPKYNQVSIQNRIQIRENFRAWCNANVENILAQIPRDVFPDSGDTPYLSDEQIRADLRNTGREIDAQTGMCIAWYFGVNCVFVHIQDESYVVECQTAYQSPECKTIVIYFTRNHFEPMGKFDVDANNKMTNRKFLFAWSDPDLCLLKDLSLACRNLGWTMPLCDGAAVVNVGNGAGNSSVDGNNNRNTNSKDSATPTAWNFMTAVEQAGTPNGSTGAGGGAAGGGAAEQRGGKKRRTRKRRTINRRSNTKKGRTSRK